MFIFTMIFLNLELRLVDDFKDLFESVIGLFQKFGQVCSPKNVILKSIKTQTLYKDSCISYQDENQVRK